MATQAEVEEHRLAVQGVATLAVAELVTAWPSLPLDDPRQLANDLADVMAELYGDFSLMTAALAADFYDELRGAAGVSEPFAASIAPDLPVAQLESSASWAAGGAWTDADKALRDSAASLDRMVTARDRETTMLNVEADPSEPRYARFAQPDACAFCALLASRGAVYWSEESATFAGATRDERRQRETEGDKYHDWCGCEPVAVWKSSGFELPEYATPWVDAYDAARDALPPFPSLKTVLAHMRANAGLR